MAYLAFGQRLLVVGVRLLLAATHIVLLVVLLGGAGLVAAYRHYGRDLPDTALLGIRRPAESTLIYARDGVTQLIELDNPNGGKRTVIPFDRIPQIVKDATIAVEDASFYSHPGVDLRAIARALVQNADAGEVVSGGSTITQQLVRGVLMPPEERTRLTLDRKAREAILAFKLTREYDRDQILGMYLNEVFYGNRAYGIEAAAQSYFGRHVWELNNGEATLLAGLPQSPTRYNPRVALDAALARRAITLAQMVRHGYLTPARAQVIAGEPLRFAEETAPRIAPHFVEYVREQIAARYGAERVATGGLRVITTLDPYWQAQAERIAYDTIRGGPANPDPLAARGATNAGVIMLSAQSQILAMVGSVDFADPAIDGQVNVTRARRQPGSALKPIVYAAALQRGWTPATVVWDEPVSYPAGDGVYTPQNYDNQFHGPQRIRMALANSLNIPAIRTLEFVGIPAFVDLARQLGISTFDDPARFGLPLALGANEVQLLELTSVYDTFRNAGRHRAPAVILRVTDAAGQVLERFADQPGRQALGSQGEALAYLLTDILSDNAARRMMFGAGNTLELPDGIVAAVKTGTSNEWRDSWAVGYTPDVTVGVWVGNSDNAPMQEIAGSNGAGMIWRALTLAYLEGRPPRTFVAPAGIEEVQICADTGGLASAECPRVMTERFLAGTAPQKPDISVVTRRVAGDGSCLASIYSPAAEVRDARFLVYPERFQAWAQAQGNPPPPTSVCAAPPPTVAARSTTISAPPPNARVAAATTLLVRGAAAGPYTLEIGVGNAPPTWQPLASGAAVQDGLLGVMSASTLAPGEYTLRLRAELAGGSVAESRIQITIVAQ